MNIMRDISVQLSDEDIQSDEKLLTGQQYISMYITQDVTMNWQEEYSHQLIETGYNQGIDTTSIFHHRGRDIRIRTHRNNYVSVGKPQ